MSFARAFESDGFSLVAEVNPPKGTDLAGFLDSVLEVKGRVSAVAVTDGADAIMRMTPLVPCQKLIESNIDPVMILNGRDRNRISFQGDLLAASALGVSNLLVKEGQDPAVGDQPMARTSGDLNLEHMLLCVNALNAGKDFSGESLTGATDFLVGAGLNLSDDINVNRRKAESISRLAELGTSFVVLGPCYDLNMIDLFTKAAEEAEVKLFASIMLLKSVAMIRYLNDLPGVPGIPHEFLKQMMKSPVKQQAGMKIAAGFVKDVEDRCQGAVLISLGWGSRLPEFLSLMGC